MLFEVFNHELTARYELRPNGDGAFAHSLGGLPAKHGYTFPDLPCPLHLFARLDCNDDRLEDHDGAYGWPDYEKRFKDGRPV